MKTEHKILILITLWAGFIRFWDLGGNPLWTDEAWFGFLAFDSNITQEFIPAYFVKLIGQKSEFWLRFLSALCGTLTVPAIYYVVKQRKLELATFTAIFPLFVFWSRMARPYAVAGLFLVLAWRYMYFMIPALLCTPIALVGLKVIKQKWFVLLGALIAAGVFYFMRGDSGRDWTVSQIFVSTRWWYLPILSVVLYGSELWRIKK